MRFGDRSVVCCVSFGVVVYWVCRVVCGSVMSFGDMGFFEIGRGEGSMVGGGVRELDRGVMFKRIRVDFVGVGSVSDFGRGMIFGRVVSDCGGRMILSWVGV